MCLNNTGIKTTRFRLGKSVVVAFCLAAVILACAGRTAEAQSPDGVTGSDALYSAIENRISNLFRTQEPDGSLKFSGADTLLCKFPVLATLCLAVHRNSQELPFTSRAMNSLTRYFKFILNENDRDGDLVVENPFAAENSSSREDIEDVGFNTLLALDMMSLAQICTELKMPVEALFWREEAKLIATRVIANSFDNDAKFFFPYNNSSQKKEHFFYSLSFMPVYFYQFLGDNISDAMIRNYMLEDSYLYPEAPCDYLTLNWQSQGDADTPSSERLLKTVLLLAVLHHQSFQQSEEGFRINISKKLESSERIRAVSASDPYLGLLVDLVSTGEYKSLFPVSNALGLFCGFVYAKRVLPDTDIFQLLKAERVIDDFLDTDPTDINSSASQSSIEADTVLSNVRRVYFSLSKVREHLQSVSSSYSPWKEEAIFGADFPNAVARLLDDVVLVLNHAENEAAVLKNKDSGLNVSCVLLNETLVPGQEMSIKISVTTDKKPARLRSITAVCPPMREVLFASKNSTTIYPGDTTMTFIWRVPVRFTRESGIDPISPSVILENSTGEKLTYHFVRGVYLKKPLAFSVSFPQGKILKNWDLPIDVTFKKYAPYGATVRAGFFSPSGLQLKKGNFADIYMAAGEDSASLRLNVVVPQPCRPGSFPFVLKVIVNQRDVGMVSTNLFRHYQWIFVGPFDLVDSGLSKVFGPEQRISLFDRFKNGKNTLAWRELAENAYAATGEILLDNLLPSGGIGYLYTVIKSTVEQRCTVFLSSNVPTLLMVNGQKAILIRDSNAFTLQRGSVVLRDGMNDILIKTVSSTPPKLFFKMGGDEDLASDEFNNNLWELVEGFQDFHRKSEDIFREPSEVRQLVTLSYTDPKANSVAVIGNFNGWSPDHASMHKISGSKWEITLNLLPGKYTYRFLVNNRQHILDPLCSYQESDGYGGKNSVLFVE